MLVGESGTDTLWTVDVSGNFRLTSVAFPALEEVRGRLGFGANTAYGPNGTLSTLSLPRLLNRTGLTEIHIAMLDEVTDLTINGNSSSRRSLYRP